ncbi:MAG TPA: hydantoinase/oxoprolinase family protein [Candidatus Acidoferrales bacterium]|nr:hydantoinase/oxoprolinase family protein [Candidatus Acidoferrales bacterium]
MNCAPALRRAWGEGLVWTVDIDVGGTLTDGLFTGGDNVICVKVDTTPHDLTVCLFDCLAQGAAKLDFPDTAAFLENVELIRWSTTITSNVLAELRGPRIGLLVSEGHEKDLYGSEAESATLNRLLAARDVIGMNGAANDPTIMNASRFLLENGVRRICISLQGSHRHPDREIAWKKVIDQQYPDHFLGSVPVLAGSDISKSADDRTRVCCAVINAYTHGALAATLFKAEDDLRETSGYAGTFLVSHINGGVAGIAKTRAIDTLESGPVLGILGSAHIAKAHGLKDVVAMDVGGTTAKISVLAGAEPVYRKPSDLFGIPVELSLPYLRSIALGGGSVVKPLAGAQGPPIQLGPESMGSYPGPACYNLGGDQPTLTDAFVTAGLINPDYFLGGTKPIDREVARKTIEESVARPLHLSVEETCRAIIGRAFDMVAGVIAGAQAELQQDLSRHTLFAYGGNGGLFACGVAEKAGLANVQTFSLGPVFSAFGSSVSDISHVYERALPEPAITEESVAGIRRMLDEMKAEGAQDLLGEGIRPENVSYALEFEVAGKGKHSAPVACPESSLRSAKDLQAAVAAAVGSVHGAISLDLFRLRVKKAMPKPPLIEQPLHGPDASHARVGKRQVFWGSPNGEAQVYRWESLRPGNRVEGCAVLEGINTTYFIPDGWAMFVDAYGNGKLNRV